MNWAEMVQRIQDSGFSQPEIANYCSCSQPQISALLTKKRGKRVSFGIGQKLVEMYEKIESGKLKKAY